MVDYDSYAGDLSQAGDETEPPVYSRLYNAKYSTTQNSDLVKSVVKLTYFTYICTCTGRTLGLQTSCPRTMTSW